MRLGRWSRRVSIVVAVLALLVGIALAIVRKKYNGPGLARVVTRGINEGRNAVRGRWEIDSIEWDVMDIVRPGHMPVRVQGLRIFDPSGKKVLDVPRAHGHIDAWKVLPGGGGDVLLSDFVIEGKASCLVEEVSAAGQTEVGFVAAFLPRHPRPAGELPPPGGPIFELGKVTVQEADLQLHFRAWQADLQGLHSDDAHLRLSFREPKPDDLDFNYHALPLTAPSGVLTIAGLRFEVKNLVAHRLGIFREDHTRMDYDLELDTAEGAHVKAKGALRSLWKRGGGADLDLEVTNAGPLAARLAGGQVGGAEAAMKAQIRGPYEDPTIHVEAEKVDVLAVPQFPFQVVSFTGDLRPASRKVTVEAAELTAFGGALLAKGSIDLATRQFKAELATLRPIDISPKVRKDIVKFARGGELSGTLTLEGTPEDMTITPRDVRLGKARVTKGNVRIAGAEVIYQVRIQIEGQKTTLDVGGTYNTRTKQLDAKLKVDIDPLGPWLTNLQAAPVVRWFFGRAKVLGTYDTRSGGVNVKVTRVNLLDSVKATAVFKNDVLTIKKLLATPLGGKMTGTGKVRLGPAVRLEKVTLDGSGLDLRKAGAIAGTMTGTGRFHVVADGAPSRKWQAQIEAFVDSLAIGTYRLGDARAQLELDEVGATITQLRIGRPPAGTLDVVGKIGFDSALDLTVDLRRYPIGTLPGLSDHPELGVMGNATVRATVGGTITRPDVHGLAQVFQIAFRKTILGGADVKLEPWPDGRVHFSGSLFGHKMSVDGYLRLEPFEVLARVAFRRLEVNEFLPELSETIGAHGWGTGVGTITIGADVSASLTFNELVFALDGTDEGGRPRPLVVKNVDKVYLEYKQGVARFLRPVQFEGPDGDFQLEGSVGAKAMDVVLTGKVQLSLLAFYTRRYLEESAGSAVVNLRLFGDPRKPKMRGTLAFKDAAVRRPRQETWIRIPQGRFVIDNDKIVVENLILEVDEVDKVRTVMYGTVTLKNYLPDQVSATVKGHIAARLIEVLFPSHVSASKGAARIDLSISGAFKNPDIDGTLTFDRVFQIAPRGFRRDVAITRGKVRFNNKEILLRDVRGAVDDVQDNLLLSGNPDPSACTSDGYCVAVRLYEWSLVDLYVAMQLNGFTHRIPGILEVEANTSLTLTGDLDGLQLRGAVDIVDGRYSQSFRPDQLLRPERVTERSDPFWRNEPLLRDTTVYLQVTTNQGAFRIENNVATTSLSGTVTITGTPAKPRFEGQISMGAGTVKIPLTRPRFSLQQGTVTFFPDKDLPDETPEINLTADSQFEDLAGTTHLITLMVTGPLGKLQTDLSTNTGLNAAQTLQLITLRRSDLDDLARGRASGRNTSDETRGQTALASQDTFTSAADPVIKEAFSNYISILVEDPVRKRFRADCFRVATGLESVGFYACWDILQEYFRFELEGEKGLRGGSTARAGGKLQLSDQWSIDAYRQRLDPLDEREETENINSATFKWKFLIP